MHELSESRVNPSPELQIVDLISQNDETYAAQKNAFLTARLGQLESETSPYEGPMHAYRGHHDGFIAPTTDVRPVARSAGFRLDDPRAYSLALDAFRAVESGQEVALHHHAGYVGTAIAAAQMAQEVYFGNIKPTPEQEDARNVAMAQGLLSGEATEPFSIKELQNVALCTERAALAHNMLKVLGVQTKIVFGRMRVEDGNSFGHTFLQVEDGQGGSMIYDPTNPWLTYNEAQQITHSEPAKYPLPEVHNGQDEVETGLKVRVEAAGQQLEAVQRCTYSLAERTLSAEDQAKVIDLLAQLYE